MSPSAGILLVEEIAPRLRAAVPRSVKTIGAEDPEELVQDAITMAAQMLERVEAQRKKVTPGNIAYFTILHMKSGRRSQGSSRSDIMAAGTQLDAKSCVLSMAEEVGYDPELDEPIELGSLLACEQEDPSARAAKHIDWQLFVSTHDYRYGIILHGMATGESLTVTAERSGHPYMTLWALKEKLAVDLLEFLGTTAIEDAMQVPVWRSCLNVDKEKTACRADRRRL